MEPVGRVRIGIAALVAVTVIGAIGYVVIADVSFVDAIYMVVITVTTVGFAEVFDLDAVGRMWTVAIIISGVGTVFYTIGAGFEQLFLLGGRRRRIRIMHSIDHLSGHIILCGYGRVGRGTAEKLQNRRADVVVVDADPDRYDAAVADGFAAILGDATHNSVLESAGIHNARSVVACVSEDSDNLVISLSAKALVPDIMVVSRATEPESESKLKLAGADRVVTPQAVGADRLAALTLQPALTDFFDIVVGGHPVEFQVEEIEVTADSAVKGRSIRASSIREASGALILAVEDANRTMLVNPDPDLVLTPGCKVICVGTKGQIEAAASLF